MVVVVVQDESLGKRGGFLSRHPVLFRFARRSEGEAKPEEAQLSRGRMASACLGVPPGLRSGLFRWSGM